MSSMKNRSVVVIGAGGAIGEAVCRAFAHEGAQVWAGDRNEEAAHRVAVELGGDARSFVLDVTVPKDVDAAASEISTQSNIDTVVYSVGIDKTSEVANIDPHDYRRIMAANLDGAFFTATSFVRPMLKSGNGGNFIFMSSLAGKRGEAGASVYCATKFAMIGMMQSFALEVANKGIRVNCVCPGNVDSPMLEGVAAGHANRLGISADEVLQTMKDAAAGNRLVSVDEVAAAALWLGSDAASGVTGISLNVDAGIVMP